LYGELRRHLGGVLGKLAEPKEIRIERSQIQVDHVHTRKCASASRSRKRRTSVCRRCLREADEPPSGGPQDRGRVSDPASRFERLIK
jgi:hypothetical protein